MTIQLSKKFHEKVQGIFQKYEFQVGILEDKEHKKPKQRKQGQDNIAQYAGGPIRKKQRLASEKTIAQVSQELREKTGINYLTEPFEKSFHSSGAEFTSSYNNSDIQRFLKEFFKLAFGKSEKRRCENLLQAVVRNPILRGDYGANSPMAEKIKGFDRYMIDTAQFFKAIKATCKVKHG
jgi:hypothetical protein